MSFANAYLNVTTTHIRERAFLAPQKAPYAPSWLEHLLRYLLLKNIITGSNLKHREQQSVPQCIYLLYIYHQDPVIIRILPHNIH